MVKHAPRGQVFLADNEYLRRVADAAAVGPDDVVVEVGTGGGQLTQHLVRRAREVISVELEETFVDGAAATFAAYDNLTLVHGNVLDLDWDDFLPAAGQAVVVGNIPFYITGPILRVLFEHRARISRWTLLMQREVAERICAAPGGKVYGALSVKMQTWGRPRFLFVVPAVAFEPVPAVDAALVAYTYDGLGGGEIANPELFDHFVEYLFGGRRRKLANRLNQMLGGEGRPEVPAALTRAGVDGDARPEDLPPSAFAALFRAVESSLKV
jgi:16S rRNA (adenine1518-N6/adenine1519-N6)-dimethyltransferase